MGENAIYIDREDAKKTEEEECNFFIIGLLETLGVPLDDIWTHNEPLTVDKKIKLRELLSKFNIDIVSNNQGRDTEIYYENQLVGKWFQPRFILKKDISAKHASKRYFYEMIIKTWTIFEDNGENNEN